MEGGGLLEGQVSTSLTRILARRGGRLPVDPYGGRPSFRLALIILGEVKARSVRSKDANPLSSMHSPFYLLALTRIGVKMRGGSTCAKRIHCGQHKNTFGALHKLLGLMNKSNIVLVTVCTNRKTIPPLERLQAKRLPSGPQETVSKIWRAWLRDAAPRIPAKKLYAGRGFR